MVKLLELINTVHVFLTTETKPSPGATARNFQQGQTSTLPRMRSLNSAAATSSMSEAPSILSTMSEIRLASTVAGVAVIANLVPNTGEFFYFKKKHAPCFH